MPKRSLSLTALALHVLPVLAQVPSVPFLDCSRPSSPNWINISSIYAQITNTQRGRFLNLTILGQSASQILDLSNVTNLLSTVFIPTKVLTFLLNPDNESQFCSTLRPPSPLPPLQNPASNYCPLPPGPLAFAVGTQLSHSYELMTLDTRIRVVDTSNPAQEIACAQLALTPLNTRSLNSLYGHATIIFWATVALAIAYWLVIGAGRLAAAWKRGRQRVHNHLWSHIQRLGFVLASAISGERFASSPALIRFGTPSMRDVIFHTQWCALLSMVTVQWPSFTYPYFAQTAWATLLYNITLTQGPDGLSRHWYPLHADPFNPPSSFADQLADPSSPLFVNTSIPNSFFTFPPHVAPTGIPALASAVGIRPEDAFGISVGLFLLILGGTVVLSLLVFAIDWLVGSIVCAAEKRRGTATGMKSPPWSSSLNKELAESPEPLGLDDDAGAGNVRFLHRPASHTMHIPPVRTGWLGQRLGQSSFHGSILCGNLVRVLILFHLPVTIFSCFQFSQGRSHSSLVSLILATFAFVAFSVSAPALLIVRLTTTPTSKLYDETGTLLALGPLYNHYAQGSQLFACLFFICNLAYGVIIGCGQQSGSVQAIIILVVEVASALTTSVWLPWGRGATMGGISFILCVARIITAVLLVILSPIVSVDSAAGGWVAYAILVIQGLVYLGLLLMLVCKILEGVVRLIWNVSFDRSKHTIDTGLIGAIALAGCCGSRKKTETKTRSSRSRNPTRAASDATTQSMLRHPQALHSASRTTVSGPPSVLRPEQLNQPYREESDDEGGYILGAWHYEDEEPAPSSPPVPSPPATPPPPTTTTGFSRVAGGRANIDAPYTMAPRAEAPGLPPGAMAPAHIQPQSHARRRSQSAIIEEQEQEQQKVPAPSGRAGGKHWFGLFGARGPRGDTAVAAAAPTASEGLHDAGLGVRTAAGAGGRSFVVIRERRPSPLSQSISAGDEDGSGENEVEEAAPRSFSVVRPSRARGLLSRTSATSGFEPSPPLRDGT